MAQLAPWHAQRGLVFTLVQAASAVPMSTAESSPPLKVSLITYTLVTQ